MTACLALTAAMGRPVGMQEDGEFVSLAWRLASVFPARSPASDHLHAVTIMAIEHRSDVYRPRN